MSLRPIPLQRLFVSAVIIVLISSFVVEAQQVPSFLNGSSAAANCTQCSIRKMDRYNRIRAIEDILRKKDSPVDSPRCVQVNDTQATTSRFIFLGQTAPPVYSENAHNIFTFNFTADLANQQVVNATMGIFIRRPTTVSSLITTWILIYRLRPLPSQERVLIHRRKVFLNQLSVGGQWFTFNMKNYVENSVSHMNATIAFIVQASDARGEPLAVVNPQNESEEVLKPYLEIHVRDRSTSRNKQTTGPDCRRYPLVVDFKKFGWDWVLRPFSYSAYYCSGKCSLQRYPHTNLTQQTNKIAGTSCCSPKKVSRLSMLYIDDKEHVVYSDIPGMVIDQCGCW